MISWRYLFQFVALLVCLVASNYSKAVELADLDPPDRLTLLLPYIKTQVKADVALLNRTTTQYQSTVGSLPDDINTIINNNKLLDGSGWSLINSLGFTYEINPQTDGSFKVGVLVPEIGVLLDNLAQIDLNTLETILKPQQLDGGQLSAPDIDFSADDLQDKVAQTLIVASTASSSKEPEFEIKINNSNVIFNTSGTSIKFTQSETVFDGELKASGIYDADDIGFRLVEGKTVLNQLNVGDISLGNTATNNIDLEDTVLLNDIDITQINTNKAQIKNVTAAIVNGSPALNLGGLPSFSVTQVSPGVNTEVLVNGIPTKSGVGTIALAVVDDPIFNNVTLNDALTVGAALNIDKQLSAAGDLTVAQEATIKNSLSVGGNADLLGNQVNLVNLIVGATTNIDTDVSTLGSLYFSNVNGLDKNVPNISADNIKQAIAAAQKIALAAANIDLNASDNIRIIGTTDIQATQISINENFNAQANLDVTGNITLGSDASDTLTLNGVLQGENVLVLEGGVDIGRYSVRAGNPANDIVITLPDNQTGSSQTLGVLYTDSTQRLKLPGTLQVTEGIEQTNSLASNTLAGTLTVNNPVTVASGTNTPITVTRTDTGKLLSLNASDSEIGLYSLNSSPDTVLSADRGSLAVDVTTGEVYVNQSGASSWVRLLHNKEGLVQGGNSFGETFVAGSVDEQGVNIITSGTTALAIDTSQNVSLSANLNIEDALTVKGNTSLQGNVILGDASTDQVTITGTIQNDLRFKGAATGDITLARSAPDTDITLTLPAISGTMVALDSVNNNLSLPNQLNVTNGIKQTASTAVNTLAGKLEINNDLAVSTVDETVASFTRSNVGELLAFSVDGGANSFGLYASGSNPSNAAAAFGADGGVGSLSVNTLTGALSIQKRLGTEALSWDSFQLSTTDNILQGGNAFGEKVIIGTTETQNLELMTNNQKAITIASDLSDATKANVAFAKSLDLAKGISVTAGVNSTALDITGDTIINGDVILGTNNEDEISIAAVLQKDLLFKGADTDAGINNNVITLKNSAPTSNIALTLPEQTGTLLALIDNAATTEIDENVLNLPGSLSVVNSIVQTNTEPLSFGGSLQADNGIIITTSSTPIRINTDSNKLIAIQHSSSSDLGLYSNQPTTVSIGSLSINQATGQLSVFSSDGGVNEWTDFYDADNAAAVMRQNGNARGDLIKIGATDNYDLKLITNNADALVSVYDADTLKVNTTIQQNLTAKDISVSEQVIGKSIDVSGVADFDGDIDLGNALADQITLRGTIKGSILYEGYTLNNDNTTKTLVLPSVSGTLLGLDASGDLIIRGNVSANQITQTNVSASNTLAAKVIAQKGLSVSDTGSVAASFTTTDPTGGVVFERTGSNASRIILATSATPTNGTLNINTTEGNLSINNGELITGGSAFTDDASNSALSVGGNTAAGTINIGSTSNQSINLITNNVARLSIGNSGNVTLVGNVTANKQLTVSEAMNAQSTLTVADASNLNGPVTLGDARTDNITIKGTIKDDLKLEGTTIKPAAGTTIALNLPNTSGTLLSAETSGNLSLTGTLSAANLTQSSSSSTNTFAGATTINNTLAVSSGSNTPLSLTTTGNQLLNLTSGDGSLGIYAADDITGISGAIGSLGLDQTGDVYIRKTSEWARIYTDSTTVGDNTLSSGGDAPTSTLKIGTTNANNVELIANNTVGLSLTSAGNVSIAKGLTLSGGGINQTSTTANAFAGSMTIAGSTRINNTLTVASGSNIPVSLQRTSAGQFLSFSDGSNSFGLYSTTGTGAPTLGTGSIGVSTTDGHLYLGLSGGASRVLTEADNVILQGGNALSGGALNIGTTSGSGVNVIVNGNNALSFNTSGAASFANALSVTGVTSLANTNITGSLSLSSSSLSVPGETAGATATLTLPNRTGTLLTDQDEVSNIASNSIENTQLSAGSFSKITGVGTLSSLNVSSGISAASLSLSSVAAGSSSALDLCLEETSVVTCSSLGALKRDIVPLNMGSETLMKLTPRQFKWQGDGQADIGFIAEEVAAVNPILAQYDAQGDLKGVKYRHLTALLTKVLQSQQVQLSSINQAANFASGRLGVGREAHNDYRLDVAGQVRASGFIESSDARLKQNIQTIPTGLGEGVLGRLAQIDGVYYDWNHTYRNLNGNASVAPQVGVLAQQVEAVLPRIVETDSRGYKTVAYSKLTPYLLEGLKELNEDLEPLREALQVGENGLNIQADKLQFSDIVLSGDADRFQVKRSRSLSNLMSVSTRKVADTKAQGYISAKDVYLADANMWWSEFNQRVEAVDQSPMQWECANEKQQGNIKLVSNSKSLYICDSNSGWKKTSLSFAGG